MKNIFIYGSVIFIFVTIVINNRMAAKEPSASYFSTRLPVKPFPSGDAWVNTTRPIKLDQLQGKFVLLDFWTLGCINCMHIIPELKKIEAAWPNELVVIGVHSAKFQEEKNTKIIAQAVLRYGVEHPVINDSDFASGTVLASGHGRAWCLSIRKDTPCGVTAAKSLSTSSTKC